MKAHLTVNKSFEIGEIDRRLYGSFVEHLGRSVYEGIYEPTHEGADADGFRRDVLELVRELDVSILRYPGGNFVSGYNWEDGVGDKSRRPRRLDLSWRTVEPNEVGTDEFPIYAKKAGAEVLMAVNLGTRGATEAGNLVEYCNLETDTYYANMRRQNGHEKPFGIKLWCLGNEMDGPWQLGQKSADEYGRLAAEAARVMRLVDPTIELSVCGSSHYSMPTFGDWEYTVLSHTYNLVDYISLHEYYGNVAKNSADFLGRGVHMDSYIKATVALCDAVGGKFHTNRRVNLSFDEWNVWHYVPETEIRDWQSAPHLLEEVYTFEDALVLGSMLSTLQNNCDRVKIACLAQLVNVIAPIMTEKGGRAWRQTTYHPFMLASRYGRGTTLRSITISDTYETTDGLTVPYLDASVIRNDGRGELVLFALNRSLDEDMTLSLSLEGFEGARIIEHVELYCDDLGATNTRDCERVRPETVPVAEGDITLKKHSWNMIRFKI